MPETLIKEPEMGPSVTVSNGIYAKYIKRMLDFILSLCAIVVLSPILLVLTVIGAIVMKGKPFFVQERPGKIDSKTGEEKIFKLIKFRTMTCEKDKDGKLLPDEERLTKYGNFIRHTSLDELPELFNILVGNMSIVGPRPLLVEYIPRYSPEQRRRHLIRPGLTGYAQAYGRNLLTWDEKFKKDTYYVDNVSFMLDAKIIVHTVLAVLKVEGISSETSSTMEVFLGNERKENVDA